jgi:hypothetical protein
MVWVPTGDQHGHRREGILLLSSGFAGLLITTEAMVAEVPSPPPSPLPGHDHDDHHGDMEL